MKDFPGIPFASLPPVESPDFLPRLRNMLGTIDGWGRDASVAFGRITKQQVPNGSGDSLFGGSSTRSASPAVQGPSASGNIQEWYDFSGTLVGRVDSLGVFHSANFTADTSAGLAAGVHATIAATGNISGNALFILDTSGSPNATITSAGAANFSSLSIGVLTIDLSGNFSDSIGIIDTGTGNAGTISWAGIGVGDAFTLPVGGGGVLTSSSTATNVTNKTMAISTNVRCSTGTGVTFQDSSSTTKQMRFDLTGITAATTRNQKWQDTAGSVVTVGNTTSASGVLGTIALTAQTGSLGAQTLLTGNASSAGLYRVSFYLKCSTAGTAGSNVTATLAWNEGTAQTMVVAFLGGGGTNSNTVPYVGHDLGTANTFSEASVVVRASASQNITFTTTITVVGGSPAYNFDARIEALG